MKEKRKLTQLIFLSFCIVIGSFSKQIISPVTDLLTDVIRLPGGAASGAFSVAILAVGAVVADLPFAGTAAGFVQGALAFFLGLSGRQGAFAFLTYPVPGLVLDLFRHVFPQRRGLFFFIGCAAANAAGSVLSGFLVFHFPPAVLPVWWLTAALSGLLSGGIGYIIYTRISDISVFR